MALLHFECILCAMWKGTSLSFYTPNIISSEKCLLTISTSSVKSPDIFIWFILCTQKLISMTDRLISSSSSMVGFGFFFLEIRKIAFISILLNPELVCLSLLLPNLFFIVLSPFLLSHNTADRSSVSAGTCRKTRGGWGCSANKHFYGNRTRKL